MITDDDYLLTLEALASCAIEGNTYAIELLELKKRDPKQFFVRLYQEGLMDKEEV